MKVTQFLTLPKHFNYQLYLLPFWKKEAFILLLNIITMYLGLVNPYLTKLVIDKAYGNKDLKLFIILLMAGAILFLVNNFLSAITGYLKITIRTKIKFNLTAKVFSRLQELPLKYFRDNSSSQNLYRFNYDIEIVSSLIADVLPQLIQLVFKTATVMVIIFILNWKMAVCSVILMPFLYYMTDYFNKKMEKKWEKSIEISQKVFILLNDILTHMHLIKAFGKERYERRKYIKTLIENIRFNLKLQKYQSIISNIQSIISKIVLGLILAYGSYQVIKGEMPLGSLIAIGIYINKLSGIQGSFSGLSQQVSLSFISCDRLDTILKEETDEKESKSLIKLKNSKGTVEFKQVSFNYSDEKTVLKDLSFKIEGGTFAGLAGPSGCGKTTIINLLLKLYRPTEGEISLDGHDIKNLEKNSFYENTGVALQNSFLWNDTIENNIKYGKHNATEEEIKEAAGVACADEFIEALPEGYKTVIGENACKISEGQRQRISIARSVIRKPSILILDEGLSSVDAETENKIINHIKEFLKDSTVIIISHRLSTMQKVDMIYFFMTPEKIDAGTFEELVRNNVEFQYYLNLQESESSEQ
ncbi:MAG: ABC transporter ATP-binding protein [Candidatus Eremiobacterota bacterium]